MEIVRLSEQLPYVAPDRAVARQIAAPGNSRLTTHSIAHIIIPAGGEVKPHYHRACEEVYHVVSGGGRMKLDGKEAEISQGDTVVILPGERHSISAPPDRDLVMIVTCVPAWSAEDQCFD
ncbi:hypothetical protein PAPYR_10079 [Paratrimastix pyriformis]|uniref:Cupin type-2 domain-containing protein n=1 Tax=Paratrimastix pyriformis TaxID=342808 RepID=A0ABQ8UCJ9_9EUKA|nr:hypothetical protein PAPYR_10079 [Paratrimastix pyriformis]